MRPISLPCHDLYGVWLTASFGYIELDAGAIAFLCACKSVASLGFFGKSTKAEVLESHDAAILQSCKVHRVVPHISLIL